MRIKLYKSLLICVIATVTSPVLAYDLTGLWKNLDVRSPSDIIIEEFSDHHLKLMGTYRDISGRQIVWYGTGKTKGYQVYVSFWFEEHYAEYGKGQLILSLHDNGDTLIGQINQSTGLFVTDQIIWARQK